MAAWLYFLLCLLPLGYSGLIAEYIPVYNQSLQGTTIECSGGRPCGVFCGSNASCLNVTIECPPDWTCTIHCNEESSCHGATINGPTNYGANLDINCVTTSSCRGVTINGGKASDISVDCNGENSCRNAVIDAPISWGLTLTGCDSIGSCIGMNITCPPNVDGVPQCILICMYSDSHSPI